MRRIGLEGEGQAPVGSTAASRAPGAVDLTRSRGANYCLSILRRSIKNKESLRMLSLRTPWFFAVAVMTCVASTAVAQERAYFVTYNHYLEETRELEIGVANTSGVPKHDDPSYHAPWLELEYGVTGWWTSELYLEGLTTGNSGGGFTGWRWENRFRLLKSEHRVNPVLYVEYESVNEASRIQKEIVGSGALSFEEGIGHLRSEHEHELEAKLILSSTFAGWNVAENFIIERSLTEAEGFELGYAIGASRHLGSLASAKACRFCRENFVAGVEMYGGLGSTKERGLTDTRHYIAPVFAWRVTPSSTLKASVGVGLTAASEHALIRLGYAVELPLGEK